jgi:hypothetical protein
MNNLIFDDVMYRKYKNPNESIHLFITNNSITNILTYPLPTNIDRIWLCKSLILISFLHITSTCFATKSMFFQTQIFKENYFATKTRKKGNVICFISFQNPIWKENNKNLKILLHVQIWTSCQIVYLSSFTLSTYPLT